MISITCTKCKAQLTIDDGFAGLACRCQHCGTIQTVPTKLKGNAPAGAASAAKAARPQPAAKALYENPRGSAAGGSGSGYQTLADAVVSSGLGSGRLRNAPPTKANPRQLWMFIAIAAVIVLALGAGGVWMLVAGRAPVTPLPTPNAKGYEPPVPINTPAGPRFADIKLEGDSVIYVLDHGQSSADFFEAMKAITLKSIRSLGPNTKFQIIFWDREGTQDQIPSAPQPATPEVIAAAARSLEDVVCAAATDPEPALKLALCHHPAAVVMVTGKNSWINTSVVKAADAAGSTKVHCIALDPGGTVLQALAKKTGGQFKEYRPGEFKSFQ